MAYRRCAPGEVISPRSWLWRYLAWTPCCRQPIRLTELQHSLSTSFAAQQRPAVAGSVRQGWFGLDSNMDFAASVKARPEAVLKLFALLEDFSVQLEHAAVTVGDWAHRHYCHTCRCGGLGGSDTRRFPHQYMLSASQPSFKTWRSGGRGSPFVSWSAHERPASWIAFRVRERISRTRGEKGRRVAAVAISAAVATSAFTFYQLLTACLH
jgi:hypothetical protein